MTVENQNKDALKNHYYFADWESFARRRGTVISDYQKLDRLQGVRRTIAEQGSDE